MRILLVSDTFAPHVSGVSEVLCNLAAQLETAGHKPLVIAPKVRETNSPFPFQLPRNVDWIAANVSLHGAALPVLLPPRRAIRRIFEQFQPDVVHVHGSFVLSRVATREAQRRAIPTVFTNHLDPANVMGRFPAIIRPLTVNWLWSITASFAVRHNATTTPSNYGINALQRHQGGLAVKKLSGGIRDDYALDSLVGLSSIPVRTLSSVVFIGRLDAEKHVEDMIRALRFSIAEPPIHLHIVGTGKYRERLEKYAARADVSRRVTFHGYLDESSLSALLLASSAFSMPSEGELESLASLKAMAHGLPVVGARSGALPELVRDGYNGKTFELGDARSLAHAMDWVLSNPDSVDFQTNNRRDAMQRAWSSILPKYELLYARAIAAHPQVGFHQSRYPGNVGNDAREPVNAS